jgi:hypothetical protein
MEEKTSVFDKSSIPGLKREIAEIESKLQQDEAVLHETLTLIQIDPLMLKKTNPGKTTQDVEIRLE